MVGSGILGLLFAILAVRALRPDRLAGPSASPVSELSDPVARALLDAFETAGPPAVDVARPKDAAEDDLSVFFPG